MNRFSSRLVVAVCGVVAVSASLMMAGAQTRAAKLEPVDPRKKGPEAAMADPGGFTLQMFILSNWPAVPGERGTIDLKNAFGANAPTMWETCKNTTEIYRPSGIPPCSWQTVCELPSGVNPPTTEQLRERFGPTNSTWLHFLGENRMIDGQQIVDANTKIIRYDVRCNRDHFAYIADNPSGYQLYRVEGQERGRTDSNFTFNFPVMALEFKGAWRILSPTDDDSRYWTAYGAYYDDKQELIYAKIGLTALHIISHATPNWVWMTFEQVDNPKATYQYFLQKRGDPIGQNSTINPGAAEYNEILQKKAGAGTKWQFYQIIGWQTAETDDSGNPVVLANSNIETYFPQTSSCMSCHAMSNIGPPDNRRLNMWQADQSGIQGRIGDINFQDIVNRLAPGQKFKQLNYVWSLREAQSKEVAKKPAAGR